ncbi:TonB-linked SusC/RagA family outer membrane protein [Arenibacter sp. ARW7G5Y1]|nr:TonB-linked SusC/RagA family outer membrane protein [Arenibacter sp. ARW7G5Y1]
MPIINKECLGLHLWCRPKMKISFILVLTFALQMRAITVPDVSRTYIGGTDMGVQQMVTGTVTDESGTPLPGANIVEKGTTNGVTADFDGNFSIGLSDSDRTLVVSYIGYATKEVPVQGRTNLTIALEESASGLDEVVVIGYGTVKKSDLTGSVSSLGTEDFNKGAQVSVDQLIQGRAAGVQVTQSSAAPGGAYSIRIRGANSITAGNEPLYVIDGLPGSPLNALNPGDIESIEVLKDASATAIYGSRGANGVILVTTKKGNTGRLQVNYEVYGGMQETAKRLDLLGARDYMGLINDLSVDAGDPVVFDQGQMDAIGSGTDWQDEIFRSAPVQNHQLSFSGGSEKTKYYFSMNYFDQEGVVVSSGIKRYGARVNIDHSGDRFRYGLNLSNTYVEDDGVRLGTGINAGASVIAAAIQMDPTLPAYNEDGTYAQTGLLDLENPVGLANGNIIEGKTDRTFGNVFVEYEIMGGLSAKLNLGQDIRNSRTDNYFTKVTKRGEGENGGADVSQSRRSSSLAEFTLNYQKDLGKDHSFSILGGYTYQDFVNESFNAGSNDFPTDAFLTDNLAAGSQDTYVVGSNQNKSQLLSYIGRANYSYSDKYLFTASFRADGSSRFGEDNKYGYFPSVALGWRINNESFLEDSQTVSNLKLRASYGMTGNQEIGNYNSLVLLGTAGDAVFDGSRYVGVAPIQLGNSDLKWETTEQYNVGLDYGFYNNRISGSIDYFRKETSDLLLLLPIPATSGFTSSLQNVGDTENQGFEFLLETQNFVGDFNWTSSLNFAAIKNQVTNLGDLPFILQGSLRFLNDYTILREGDPINSYWGYRTDGIFKSQAEVDQSAQPDADPGDIRFLDADGDGSITPDDRVVLGDPFPDLTVGLGNTFSYKGIDLNFFLQGNFGQEMLNFTRIDSEEPISFRRNRESFVLDRWTPDNPDSPNPSYLNTTGARSVNDRVVEDASFLRLSNITIGYNFPGLKSKSINSLRVYATGQNLFTITDYGGYNPDVSVLGESNIRVDYNAYPLARVLTLGIRIGM